MSIFRGQICLFLLVLGLVSVPAIAQADPIQLKVTADITKNNAFVGSFVLINVTDPAFIPYSTYLGSYSDGNLGSGFFTLSATASANLPGEPGGGFLNTQSIAADNRSGFDYKITLTFEAIGFTLPNASALLADAAFAITQLQSNGQPTTPIFPTNTLSAFLNGEQIGQNVSFLTGSASTSYSEIVSPVVYPYTLKTVYELFLPKKVQTGSSINVNSTTTVSVSAVPEPWNLVSAAATFVPVGLLYFGLRRRNAKA